MAICVIPSSLFVVYDCLFNLLNYLCCRNRNDWYMTQMILNIEDASIIPSLKEILNALRGVTVCESKEVDDELSVVAESIETGYQQAKNNQFAGRDLTSLDDLVECLRKESKHGDGNI